MTMTDTTPTPPTPARTPYRDTAATYWTNGWRGVLPLPAQSKKLTLTGWTGNHGEWPSYPDIQAWTDGPEGAGNIALRLPPTILGIDVDAYGTKPGGLVFAKLEQDLGQLPPTWRTTSRDDGTSGIRLYRIPEGLRWPGILGPGIETIRTGHRYAVVWPSTHPEGGTYRWITPDGNTALGAVPTPDQLPALPQSWIDHFTHGEHAGTQDRTVMAGPEADKWLVDRAGAGAPCRLIDKILTRGITELGTAGSRHDHMLSLTNRLVWLAGEHHHGVPAALGQARTAFLAATAGDRDPDEANAEFDRMVHGAIQLAAPKHPTVGVVDPCTDPFHGLIKEKQCPNNTSPDEPTISASALSTTSSPNSANSAGPSQEAQPPAPSAQALASPSSTTAATPTVEPATPQASSDDQADDDTEARIKRAQAAAQEVERIRAQNTARRILDEEDEDAAIADRVRRRLLDDKAAKAYKEATEPPAPPFDAGTLSDILQRPPEPPMRADGLIPWSGSALVVAQRKTGKTTLLLNFARALITGEPFLGQFHVIPLEPGERVAFLNYEVSAAQLARWAADTGVDTDRLFLVNLRGRRNPLGHTDDRAELAQVLRDQNVKAVIVDPFGRAYTGQSQNDNGEVQAFLVDLEQFVRTEVGALDLMLATHAGWDGERTRGASALEDWGDVIITLTKDDNDNRFMKAIGRDVDIEEDQLSFDQITRTLTRNGEGGRNPKARSLAKVEALARHALAVIEAKPGCSRADVRRGLAAMPEADRIPQGGSGEELMTDLLKRAEALQLIRCVYGSKGSKNSYYPVSTGDPDEKLSTTTPTTPDHSSTTPGVVTDHHYSSTLYRSSGGGADHGTNTTTDTKHGSTITCGTCAADLQPAARAHRRIDTCWKCEKDTGWDYNGAGASEVVNTRTGEVITP